MLRVPNKHMKALLDLADYMDRLDPGDYDQTAYSGCICGHCNKRAGRQCNDHRSAAIELGLSQEQAQQLFAGCAGRHAEYDWFGMRHDVLPTPHDAAKCLRYIAVTGDLPSSW
jgi:hypothetical protein